MFCQAFGYRQETRDAIHTPQSLRDSSPNLRGAFAWSRGSHLSGRVPTIAVHTSPPCGHLSYLRRGLVAGRGTQIICENQVPP